MIVETSRHRSWLSNAYLVGDRPGGRAVFVDAGAPAGPLLEAADEHDLSPEFCLLTHGHPDHVAELDALREAHDLQVLAHEAERVPGRDGTLGDGDVVEVGDLSFRALLTPGHTAGHLAFVVNEEACFTGDVLFRGSVGGSAGGGSTGFEDLRRSVLDVLMALLDETRVWPGHSGPTTIGDERESNPFVRCWSGRDEPLEEPCRAMGRPATLLCLASDYDDGTKAWVRWEDGGLDVVPGSRVERG